MNLLVVIGLALGLSMDAVAVSIASGAAYRDIRAHHALRMAIFFGGFQAFMPLLGWAAGSSGLAMCFEPGVLRVSCSVFFFFADSARGSIALFFVGDDARRSLVAFNLEPGSCNRGFAFC